MLKSLYLHFLSLPHWKQISIELILGLFALTAILWVCAWVFKSVDEKYTVENLPTEDQLRKRDEERAHQAYMIFTKGKTK